MDKFEKSSVIYHDIFGFPLKSSELTKWKVGKQFTISNSQFSIDHKDVFQFLKGRENTIKQRLQNEKTSIRKIIIAKKAATILSHVPTIKMIAVTGSLAMMNSSEDGDIDLLIITRRGLMWLSRLLVLMILFLLDVPVRRSDDSNQKDKLCLNMWLDESDLVWRKPDRNLYTAHEIAQIIPLFNKAKTYEKFIFSNKWILDYWPNAVEIGNWKLEIGNSTSTPKTTIFEQIAYKIQLLYMKRKISREVVTPTRALFHPHDWGKVVLNKLRW